MNLYPIFLLLYLGYGTQLIILKPMPHLEGQPGWLRDSRLTDFMPLECDAMGRELQDGKTERAVPYFKQAYYKSPNNLAFFLCYIQPSVGVWSAERKRLEGLLINDANNVAYQAQLGAIYYYQWAAQWATQQPYEKRNWNKKQLKQAIVLVKPSWEKEHDPVGGMLLFDMYVKGGYPLEETRKLHDDMLRYLGGEKTFAKYEADRKKNWNATPPPASWIPKSRMREFIGVIVPTWVSYSTRRSVPVKQNGKEVYVPFPRPPAQERAFQYHDKLFKDLLANIPKQ